MHALAAGTAASALSLSARGARQTLRMGASVAVFTKASIRKWRAEQAELRREGQSSTASTESSLLTPALRVARTLAIPAQSAADLASASAGASDVTHPSSMLSPVASRGTPSSVQPTNLSTKRLASRRVPAQAPKRKRPKYTQSVLDFGQRDVDWKTCAACGMGYVGGSGDDIARHRRMCRKLVRESARGCSAMDYSSWSGDGEWLLGRIGDGRKIVGVREGCRDLLRAKAVDRHVTEVLGGEGGGIEGMRGRWLGVFVIGEGRVLAYALVEVVKSGRKVCVVDRGRVVVKAGGGRIQGTRMGVRRVWAEVESRRSRLAMSALDAGRKFLLPGQLLGRDAVAFTTPTESGAGFAKKYCGGEEIVVYVDSDVAG